jgi:hypothetical protein
MKLLAVITTLLLTLSVWGFAFYGLYAYFFWK